MLATTDRVDAQSASEEPVSALAVVCSPDRLTVQPWESLRVTAAVDGPAVKPLRFGWTVPVGSMVGLAKADSRQSEATWHLEGATPGPYTATIQVIDAAGSFATCALHVEVVERARGVLREVGRSWLLEDESEEEGYGLYSYILFGSPPTSESEKQRYLKILEEYLDLLLEIAKYRRRYEKVNLNVTYLPLAGISRAELKAEAETLLENYDYVTAGFLLRRLPGTHLKGPYIVSSLQRLTEVESLSGHYLFQDLSRVPVDLIPLWMHHFKVRTAHQRFWEENTARQLAIELRTALGIAADGFHEVRAALKTLIDWKS